MIDKRVFNRFLMSAVAVGSIAYAGAAAAQNAAPAQSEPQGNVGDPGDIVVTAQRRTERLQDVPVAVTALSGETIERSGLRSLTDIQYLAPSVQYTGGSAGGFQVRGVGTQGFDYSLDKSVGIMIDDVVQGIPRDPGLSSLTDIAQVEILRGPQGTLFGKNTSAGVVVITTKRPELNKFSVDARGTYGTDNERLLQANINIPLSDTAAVRLSAHNQHRDGYARNVLTGDDLGWVTDWGVRGKLLWQPSDALDVYVIGSYQKYRSNNLFLPVRSAFAGGTYAAQLAAYGIVPGPRNEDIADNAPSLSRNRVWGITTTINYQIGNHTLTSVTGYRKFRGSEAYATDSVPQNFLDENVQTGKARQFTQEFRLTSPDEGALTYVFGLYYFNTKVDATQIKNGFIGLPPALIQIIQPGAIGVSITGGVDNLLARTKSYAAFGQATLKLGDNLRLIAGGRYTRDKVRSIYRLDRDPRYFAATAVPPFSDATIKAKDFSYRLGVQYDFAQDVMGYFTYSTSYKGPAFSNLVGEALPVRPETSTAFEAGVKAELFERRLTINIAAFHQKYKDFQAQVFDATTVPPAYRLGNAGRMLSKGIELEMTARPTSRLSLNGAVAYIPARYTEFIASCYPGQPLSAVPGVGCYQISAPGQPVVLGQDLKGKPLPFSRDWSFSLGANYRHPVSEDMSVEISANYIWKDDSFGVVPDPRTTLKAYGLLGANISVGPDDGRWRVGMFARNLLDKHFVGSIQASPFDPRSPAAGTTPGYINGTTVEARRTVGIMFNMKFGD